MEELLRILMQSSTGITKKDLNKKCQVEGISNPWFKLRGLIKRGYVRIDYRPEPLRFKATKKAWYPEG